MKTFQKAPLALAITALMAAPYALANEFETNSDINSDFTNSIDVELMHSSDTDKAFRVRVGVRDPARHYSGATVDSKQLNDNNDVENIASDNNATVEEGVGAGASGNIGINVAAGDNNSQANDAALSASDAARVFGQAAAFSAQSSSNNNVRNSGSPNNAVVGGSSLQDATGNIGLNVAAGVANAQQNSLAASANTNSGSADATAGGVQTAYNNTTNNEPHIRREVQAVAVDADFEVDASGLIMDQIGDVYPDIWTGSSHPGGSADGHFDLDTITQGGSDYNDDGGALAFMAAGDTTLEGTISGQMPAYVTVYEFHSNDATLGGNALSGASGNIGVNVAAGTNNLQRNSMSIASASGGANGGGGGGGEQ
ncbi:hypothetical protein [Halomonas ventosae]|uniref:Adhesin n=1 Tax=Halomonas ventosae TaxID=229007 RepID=A0A2T0VQ72_9GAMM|nr:hypothetical protein [Halomonas ventosae]PRY72627.1 hypothetical protein BCL64_103106 [Halomonas ventosae]